MWLVLHRSLLVQSSPEIALDHRRFQNLSLYLMLSVDLGIVPLAEVPVRLPEVVHEVHAGIIGSIYRLLHILQL